MVDDAGAVENDLLAEVIALSGLASIIAPVAVARACIRAGVAPKALTPESLLRVLPHLEQTLRVYVPDDAARRTRAMMALTRRTGERPAAGGSVPPPSEGAPASRRKRPDGVDE